jgi:hypothetical protein
MSSWFPSGKLMADPTIYKTDIEYFGPWLDDEKQTMIVLAFLMVQSRKKEKPILGGLTLLV